MTNLKIYRRSDAERSDGAAPLYAMMTIDGVRTRLSLDIEATEKEWDPIKQVIRGHSQRAKDKNLIIRNTMARINDILVKSRLAGERLTKEKFVHRYKHPSYADDSFVDYAISRLDLLKPAITSGTWRHHKAVLDKLKQYAPRLTFDEVTCDWLRVYAAHLRDDHHNSPGTIGKNLCIIRAHYLAGIRDGKTRKNPFETFRMPRAEPTVTFLDAEELQLVTDAYREHRLPEPEQSALKIWLWMAFTGMHISDARDLRIEKINEGMINYERIKTKVRVRVPLSAPAKVFFESFARGRKTGYLIDQMPTDQWFNRRIKSAMEMIGIDKNISAKSARHTFASVFYEKTKDIATLSRLLGHTSVRHTMVYTHIFNKTKEQAMTAFDSFV